MCSPSPGIACRRSHGQHPLQLIPRQIQAPQRWHLAESAGLDAPGVWRARPPKNGETFWGEFHWKLIFDGSWHGFTCQKLNDPSKHEGVRHQKMVEHSQLNQPISTFWWGVRYDLMLRIQLNGPRFFPPISGHFRWGSEVICASGRCSPGIGWPRRGGRWRSAMGGRDVHGYMINDRSMRSDVHKSKNSELDYRISNWWKIDSCGRNWMVESMSFRNCSQDHQASD